MEDTILAYCIMINLLKIKEDFHHVLLDSEDPRNGGFQLDHDVWQRKSVDGHPSWSKDDLPESLFQLTKLSGR